MCGSTSYPSFGSYEDDLMETMSHNKNVRDVGELEKVLAGITYTEQGAREQEGCDHALSVTGHSTAPRARIWSLRCW